MSSSLLALFTLGFVLGPGLGLGPGTARAAPPQLSEPTEAEWTELLQGEAVARGDTSMAPAGAWAWVEVEAPAAEIWKILTDPAESVAASSSVTAVTLYREEARPGGGRLLGYRYDMTVAWTDIHYHVLRELDPAAGHMTWSLDPTMSSDLIVSQGHYALRPGRTSGHLLLHYKSQADSGKKIPTWLQQWLSNKALVDYLEFIRDRAEGIR